MVYLRKTSIATYAHTVHHMGGTTIRTKVVNKHSYFPRSYDSFKVMDLWSQYIHHACHDILEVKLTYINKIPYLYWSCIRFEGLAGYDYTSLLFQS